MCESMTDKELTMNAIKRYCDLQRIKKFETGENPELEFQLKEAKTELTAFGVNIEELKY